SQSSCRSGSCPPLASLPGYGAPTPGRPTATTTPASRAIPPTDHPDASENTDMNAYGLYLAALHTQDLLEEAELSRRAKLSRHAEYAEPETPVWRRRLGGLLSSAAQRLDPSLDRVSETALTSGRGANALPAC